MNNFDEFIYDMFQGSLHLAVTSIVYISNTVGGGYYGTEDYGTARALFAQTLDLFIFRALRDRGLRDTSKATK